MAPVQTISETLIPLIVGIAALTILDNSLGNWSQDGFRKIFEVKEVRLIALFGAAYGANGGRLIPAFLAMLLYNFLENDTSTLMRFFGINPFDTTASRISQNAPISDISSPGTGVNLPGTEINSPSENKSDSTDTTPSSER